MLLVSFLLLPFFSSSAPSPLSTRYFNYILIQLPGATPLPVAPTSAPTASSTQAPGGSGFRCEL